VGAREGGDWWWGMVGHIHLGTHGHPNSARRAATAAVGRGPQHCHRRRPAPPDTPPTETPPPPDIKTRDDVLKMGIDVYNEECRSIVMR
jgi:hypothetical protein